MSRRGLSGVHTDGGRRRGYCYARGKEGKTGGHAGHVADRMARWSIGIPRARMGRKPMCCGFEEGTSEEVIGGTEGGGNDKA